jgi:hypothetical protein
MTDVNGGKAQAEAEVQHRAMVDELRTMLAADGIEIVSDEYHYESFGLWVLTVVRDGHPFKVSWDGFEWELECFYVMEAPPLHSIPSFAHRKLRQGLRPETLPLVRAFVVEQSGRALRGEVVPPQPVSYAGFNPGLGTIGLGLIGVGLFLAVRTFDLSNFPSVVFPRPNLEMFSGAPAIVAGVVLLVIAARRRRAGARRG